MFMQIQKVDTEQRLVFGRLTSEQVDDQKEIFDYDTSAPLVKAWSEKLYKNSGGKSYGNVRAMHNRALIAAGKLVAIDFDDDGKTIEACAKIVDDTEWGKVQEGLYTGFSFGGRYVKRWPDQVHKGCFRYTINPFEITLGDIPSVPDALFTAIKTVGGKPVAERRPFKATGVILKRWNLLRDFRAQVLANKFAASTDDGINATRLVLARRVAPALDCQKGLFTVSWFADLLDRLSNLTLNVASEEAFEQDGSEVPEDLRAVLRDLAEALTKYTQEEVSELLSLHHDDDEPTTEGAKIMNEKQQKQKALVGEVVEKMSTAEKDSVQAIHDHAGKMGASCASDDDAGKVVQKVTGERDAALGDVAKVTGERDALKLANTELETSNGELNEALKTATAKIAELNAVIRPAAGHTGAGVHAVTKTQDVAAAGVDAKADEVRKYGGDPDKDPAAAFRKATDPAAAKPYSPVGIRAPIAR